MTFEFSVGGNVMAFDTLRELVAFVNRQFSREQAEQIDIGVDDGDHYHSLGKADELLVPEKVPA